MCVGVRVYGWVGAGVCMRVCVCFCVCVQQTSEFHNEHATGEGVEGLLCVCVCVCVGVCVCVCVRVCS